MVSSCNCRIRTCERCGPRLGWGVRQRLLGNEGFWRRPEILTLTIDRKAFAGPREAWEAVTGKRAVAELMRALGVKRWMWVLEFQQKTGAGWPHWHVLVDLEDLPRKRIDLKRAWALWRDKWKLGGLNLTEKGVTFASAQHAIFYLTKYITKMPEGGFPEWVLGMHSLRFLGGCRALGPLVSDQVPAEKKTPGKEPPERYKARRPHLERNAACGTSSRVYAHEVDTETGEEKFRYLGTLPASPALLVEARKAGMEDIPDVERVLVPDGDDDVKEGHEVELLGAPESWDVKIMRERMEDAGWVERQERARQERRQFLLSVNRFRNRAAAEAAGDDPKP